MGYEEWEDYSQFSGSCYFKETIARSNKPLPGHGCSTVNAIEEFSRQCQIKKMVNIKTPMKIVFKELCKFGMIQGWAEIRGNGDEEI
ncbi:hypothetical protein SESBI_07112 [Sesbania bispinosa]|nr:hypothetical protein SESBI_07112 [Sesbania bispinosa]